MRILFFCLCLGCLVFISGREGKEEGESKILIQNSSLVVFFEHKRSEKSDEHRHLIETQGARIELFDGDDLSAKLRACEYCQLEWQLDELQRLSSLQSFKLKLKSSATLSIWGWEASDAHKDGRPRFITSFNIDDKILWDFPSIFPAISTARTLMAYEYNQNNSASSPTPSLNINLFQRRFCFPTEDCGFPFCVPLSKIRRRRHR